MKPTDSRFDDIIAGTQRIREEKPYDDSPDAIAALDWITAAISDLRSAQRKLKPADILDIAELEKHITVLEGLHRSITAKMTANDQHLPGRHGGRSSDALDI